MRTDYSIKIKTEEEIAIMREAGKILASVIDEVRCSLKIGMTTKEVDIVTEKAIEARKVIPAFKGYRGFPGCACISVNEEVVHGIPGTKVVQEGDIVSLDVGVIHKGYYSDTAVTFPVGKIPVHLETLLDVTQQALFKGIEQAKVNNRLSDISHAIQVYAEERNFSIVRDFVGHGIGKNLHEDPEIPNFGSPHEGPILKEGMVFAIEPMVNVGTWETVILDDGWTVVTKDGKCSAHFEHCVAITKEGPEILTVLA
ncbi:MAG: type I methionyl aminopeptidase [Candidatus Omnitrophica bacterium]|nr:type I methionyl aminopeptidase [Candidatus Omnitrophota bacterium]